MTTDPTTIDSNTLVAWVDERIRDMLRAPRMYGSDEVVEMQVLLLLEVRALATDPERSQAEPRRVLGAYVAHARKKHDHIGPLFELVAPDYAGANIAAALREAIAEIAPGALEGAAFPDGEEVRDG